jgi:hypothetical protein
VGIVGEQAAKKARIEEKMKQRAALARRESVCSSAAIASLQKSDIGWAVRPGTDGFHTGPW